VVQGAISGAGVRVEAEVRGEYLGDVAACSGATHLWPIKQRCATSSSNLQAVCPSCSLGFTMFNIGRSVGRKEHFLREIKGSHVVIPDTADRHQYNHGTYALAIY
jgi:hypothetical protein